jgi:hypothetical protein
MTIKLQELPARIAVNSFLIIIAAQNIVLLTARREKSEAKWARGSPP